MTPATHEQEDLVVGPMLYMARELSNQMWKLTLGDSAMRRQGSAPAGDAGQLRAAMA